MPTSVVPAHAAFKSLIGCQSGLLHAIAEVIEGIFEFGSWKPVLDQVTERDTLVYF